MGSRTASRVRPLRVRWKLVLGYGHTRLRRGTGVAMLLLLIFIPTALVLRAREKANVTFDAISARLTAYGNLLRAHATAAPQFPEVHIARVTKRPIVPASGPVVTIFSPVNDREWLTLTFRADEMIRQVAPRAKTVAIDILDARDSSPIVTSHLVHGEPQASLRFQRTIDVFGRKWIFVQERGRMLKTLLTRADTAAAIIAFVLAVGAWIIFAMRLRSVELGPSMLDALADVLMILEPDGAIVFASESVPRVLGYDAGALIGRSILDFVNDDSYRALRDTIERIDRGDRETSCRVRLRASDGTMRDMEATLRTIIVEGKARGALLTLHDVTDLLMLQHQLDQAARVESLGRVAANVAHEFNNLLMTLQTYADLLQRKAGDDPAYRTIGTTIQRAVSRGTSIAAQVLRFSRPMELEATSIDVLNWVESLEEDLRALVPPRIDVTVDVAEEAMEIRGDSNQLSQVVTNLVVNARDAMPASGWLRFTIERSRGGRFPFGIVAPGHYAHLVVSDRGAGMPPEVLERIFEPLFTTKRSGTGLGLAICHQIITAHHGSIFAESEVGAGSGFHVFLPLTGTE
ncbi:MAG TPA: ATP-binding protein [Thermoanaerobaculia bacterium]|nr:ATP-binding protein [Thermoanaerobaculia bacterium]